MTEEEFQALPYSGSVVRHTPSGLVCQVKEKHPADIRAGTFLDCCTVEFPRGAVISISREMLETGWRS